MEGAPAGQEAPTVTLLTWNIQPMEPSPDGRRSDAQRQQQIDEFLAFTARKYGVDFFAFQEFGRDAVRGLERSEASIYSTQGTTGELRASGTANDWYENQLVYNKARWVPLETAEKWEVPIGPRPRPCLTQLFGRRDSSQGHVTKALVSCLNLQHARNFEAASQLFDGVLEQLKRIREKLSREKGHRWQLEVIMGDMNEVGLRRHDPHGLLQRDGFQVPSETPWPNHDITCNNMVFDRILFKVDDFKAEASFFATAVTGLQVLNPPETDRTYSSFRFNQSRLDADGAWIASHDVVDECVQIDLGCVQDVRGIRIQKPKIHSAGDSKGYVKRVEVNVSETGNTWWPAGNAPFDLTYKHYMRDGDLHIADVLFSKHMLARFVAIKVKTWNEHISMRVGVLIPISMEEKDPWKLDASSRMPSRAELGELSDHRPRMLKLTGQR
jgi:hypothetical protein